MILGDEGYRLVAKKIELSVTAHTRLASFWWEQAVQGPCVHGSSFKGHSEAFVMAVSKFKVDCCFFTVRSSCDGFDQQSDILCFQSAYMQTLSLFRSLEKDIIVCVCTSYTWQQSIVFTVCHHVDIRTWVNHLPLASCFIIGKREEREGRRGERGREGGGGEREGGERERKVPIGVILIFELTLGPWPFTLFWMPTVAVHSSTNVWFLYLIGRQLQP